MRARFCGGPVTRRSLEGRPSGVRAMPRLPDEMLNCVVYLYEDEAHAERGSDYGGSGFLTTFETPASPGRRFAAVVTNRHVIDDGFWVPRFNGKDGTPVFKDYTDRDWFFHPDGTDLAIAPLVGLDLKQAKFKIIDPDDYITPDKYQDGNFGIGDDVVLTGRFIGADGIETNIPTVRFGHMAQSNPVPLIDDKGVTQISYIVEVKSISGYSGSPVFVVAPSIMPGFRQKKPSGLLGVDWCHPSYVEPLRDARGTELGNGLHVNSNTGFMGVIPAWKITEMVEDPTFHQKLVERVRRHMEERPKPAITTDSARVGAARPSNEGSSLGDEVLRRMLTTPPKQD
jgi:hypothetical protein